MCDSLSDVCVCSVCLVRVWRLSFGFFRHSTDKLIYFLFFVKSRLIVNGVLPQFVTTIKCILHMHLHFPNQVMLFCMQFL